MKVIRTSTIPLSLNVLLKGQLKFLNNYFTIVGLSSSGTHLEEVSLREGIAVHEVDMARNISPFKDIISLIKLILYFIKEKPIIVHSITPKAGLLSMLAAKIAGVPIRMHTFTGLIFPTREGWIKKLLIVMDKLLCWSATNVYPEGIGVKNDLLKFNITDKPLKVLANGNVNGIDLEYFSTAAITIAENQSLRRKLLIDERDFVYIFVGRLVRDKGVNELVKAFVQLSNKNAKLLLVGPREEELDPLSEDTLHAIENNSNIISVGYQSDVRKYFAISDVLVFPSYREGFPNVVLQAGAMGLPSIVSNINGSNEIILNGVNGLIIPVKNESALQKTMKTVYESPELVKELSSNARKIIVDKFDQTYVWNCIVEEYHQLINQRN